jgi:hypothetical protein
MADSSSRWARARKRGNSFNSNMRSHMFQLQEQEAPGLPEALVLRPAGDSLIVVLSGIRIARADKKPTKGFADLALKRRGRDAPDVLMGSCLL